MPVIGRNAGRSQVNDMISALGLVFIPARRSVSFLFEQLCPSSGRAPSLDPPAIRSPWCLTTMLGCRPSWKKTRAPRRSLCFTFLSTVLLLARIGKSLFVCLSLLLAFAFFLMCGLMRQFHNFGRRGLPPSGPDIVQAHVHQSEIEGLHDRYRPSESELYAIR
jgi:hypothetical protein